MLTVGKRYRARSKPAKHHRDEVHHTSAPHKAILMEVSAKGSELV